MSMLQMTAIREAGDTDAAKEDKFRQFWSLKEVRNRRTQTVSSVGPPLRRLLSLVSAMLPLWTLRCLEFTTAGVGESSGGWLGL